MLALALAGCGGGTTSAPSTATKTDYGSPTIPNILIPTFTSTSTSASATIPPGAQHSSIANVFVPPNARLEPAEDTAPGAERWDLDGTSYSDAVAQEEALLPVGKPLDGHPWCQKTNIPPGTTNRISWIWGRPTDAVIVSVFPVFSDYQTIVIRRTEEASLFCK